MSTIAERKAQYEQSALKQLMDANDHMICERCYCCDSVWEVAPCYLCGGFEDDPDEGFPADVCSACNGEGDIYWQECLGKCDDNGNHKVSNGAIAGVSEQADRGEVTRQSGSATENDETKHGK